MFNEQAVRKLWIMSAHQKEHLSPSERAFVTPWLFSFWKSFEKSWGYLGPSEEWGGVQQFSVNSQWGITAPPIQPQTKYIFPILQSICLLEWFVSETLSTWYVWIGKFNFCFDIVGSFKRWKISGWLISGLCQYSGFNVATITETAN